MFLVATMEQITGNTKIKVKNESQTRLHRDSGRQLSLRGSFLHELATSELVVTTHYVLSSCGELRNWSAALGVC